MGERPLARRLVRLAFLLRHGRSGAHWQDGWPGLAVKDGAVLWKGNAVCALTPFAQFAATAPQELAVVGSGPSLRAQDPARLPPTLLCNGAISLWPQVRALGAVIEDERFVHRHMAMIAALPPGSLAFLSPAALRAIVQRDRHWPALHPVVLLDNLQKPFRRPRQDLPGWVIRGAGGAALSPDPGRGIVPAGTVAFTALQCALACGAGDIALAGIDLSNADQPRFYEDRAVAASGIAAAQDRILAHFALAAQVAAARGVRLTCLSPVSALLKLGIPYDDRLTA